MATYVPAKRGTAYRFTLSLYARSDNQIKTAPTLAAGDVKVSKDNGALANITTLPAETPASSGILQVDLSGTEMTADLVTVLFRDAAGAEWNDVAVHIATAARQIDDLAYPATSGRSITVDASGNANANLVNIAGAAVSTSTAQLGVNVVQAGATAWGSGAITAASIAADAITAAKIADNAIDAGSIATGAITSAKFAAGAIDAAAIAADAITDAKVAADVTIASVTGAVGSVTGNVGGNVTGSVGSVATGGITAGSFAAGAIDASAIAANAIGASELATDAVNEIVDQVWREAVADHSGTAGSFADYLNYISINAWAIVADTAELQTDWVNGGRLDLLIDAIKAKTDNLPADPADASDIAASFTTVNTKLDTIDDFLDTEVAAIKAKTDSLNFTVAGQVDANIKSVAGTTVTGVGSEADPWGP